VEHGVSPESARPASGRDVCVESLAGLKARGHGK